MLDIFRKPEYRYSINPRFRAYGKARIDIAKRAMTRADWDQMWVKPTNPFPFSWGSSWKQCVEYKVMDFAAEVGFFIDILGFPVNAFDPDYAMFTSPNGDFFFSVVPAREDEAPTPVGAIRLQFMVENIIETAHELERRGVKFDQMPARVADNSAFLIGSFHTPNGIGIELWGFDARFTYPEEPQSRENTLENQEHRAAELDSNQAAAYQAFFHESEPLPENDEFPDASISDSDADQDDEYLPDGEY